MVILLIGHDTLQMEGHLKLRLQSKKCIVKVQVKTIINKLSYDFLNVVLLFHSFMCPPTCFEQLISVSQMLRFGLFLHCDVNIVFRRLILAVNILQESFNILQESFNILQESFNILQESLNILSESLNILQVSFNILQVSFNILSESLNSTFYRNLSTFYRNLSTFYQNLSMFTGAF